MLLVYILMLCTDAFKTYSSVPMSVQTDIAYFNEQIFQYEFDAYPFNFTSHTYCKLKQQQITTEIMTSTHILLNTPQQFELQFLDGKYTGNQYAILKVTRFGNHFLLLTDNSRVQLLTDYLSVVDEVIVNQTANPHFCVFQDRAELFVNNSRYILTVQSESVHQLQMVKEQNDLTFTIKSVLPMDNGYLIHTTLNDVLILDDSFKVRNIIEDILLVTKEHDDIYLMDENLNLFITQYNGVEAIKYQLLFTLQSNANLMGIKNSQMIFVSMGQSTIVYQYTNRMGQYVLQNTYYYADKFKQVIMEEKYAILISSLEHQIIYYDVNQYSLNHRNFRELDQLVIPNSFEFILDDNHTLIHHGPRSLFISRLIHQPYALECYCDNITEGSYSPFFVNFNYNVTNGDQVISQRQEQYVIEFIYPVVTTKSQFYLIEAIFAVLLIVFTIVTVFYLKYKFYVQEKTRMVKKYSELEKYASGPTDQTIILNDTCANQVNESSIAMKTE